MKWVNQDILQSVIQFTTPQKEDFDRNIKSALPVCLILLEILTGVSDVYVI